MTTANKKYYFEKFIKFRVNFNRKNKYFYHYVFKFSENGNGHIFNHKKLFYRERIMIESITVIINFFEKLINN